MISYFLKNFNHFLNWSIVNLQSVSFRCTAVIQLYIYIHIYILFQILFHYRLWQITEYSSLCYTVGPCCLSILYIVVCICQSQTPDLSLTNIPSFIFVIREGRKKGRKGGEREGEGGGRIIRIQLCCSQQKTQIQCLKQIRIFFFLLMWNKSWAVTSGLVGSCVTPPSSQAASIFLLCCFQHTGPNLKFTKCLLRSRHHVFFPDISKYQVGEECIGKGVLLPFESLLLGNFPENSLNTSTFITLPTFSIFLLKFCYLTR